jgi:hypothetical protein
MAATPRISCRMPMHFSARHFRSALLALAVITLPMEAKDVILSIRPSGKNFKDAYTGMYDELRSDFKVKDYIITKNCTAKEIIDLIHREDPRLVVLMDYSAIALFKKYQSTLSENDRIIPSISIMGIMIKKIIRDLKNATGISYEVPVVTSAVGLRSVLSLPLKKIGIVHREYLNDFLRQNAVYCKREGIDLVSIALPGKSVAYKKLIKNALSTLSRKKIDALWIPNDVVLLQPDIIRTIWIPQVRKMKIPVIVGVETLINPQLDLGTFAVLPGHKSLGTQAAEMVYDIQDNNWRCGKTRVEPPLAVFKIINLPQARKLFNVSEEKLRTVDKKLE